MYRDGLKQRRIQDIEKVSPSLKLVYWRNFEILKLKFLKQKLCSLNTMSG